MRSSVAIAGLVAHLLLRPAPAVGVTAAEVEREIGMLFAGDPGVAGGDVDADGRAGAADLAGVLRGQRSPTQPGPFGIGVQRITFHKQSATNPSLARPLETVIWYPTELGAGPIDATLGGVLGAPLAGAGSRPLLLFSHGGCGTPTQSLFLTTLLASYGMIVAAPPHPGDTLQDLPDCLTSEALLDSLNNRIPDIAFVTSSLLILNTDESWFLFRAIDANRIGIAGYSLGGDTALRVLFADRRMTAGLALAPPLVGITTTVPLIGAPVMVQGAEIEDFLASMSAQLAYDLLRSPRQLLEILNTGRGAFLDECSGLPGCGAANLTQDEAHLYVLRDAVPFLLQRIAGDPRYDAFLAPASHPPGVVFQADL